MKMRLMIRPPPDDPRGGIRGTEKEGVCVTHTIHNAYLTVTASEEGAELQSVRGADGAEYLWQGDPAYWKRRAPNLFPFVARLTGGEYEMDGNRYRLPIHGFASSSRFALTEGGEERMTWELAADGQTLEAYPRRFVFRVIYALEGSTLAVIYEVENRDLKTMRFGLGGHPGFRVPLREGLRFEDYRLTFGSPCAPRRIRFTPACFLDGTDSPYPLEDGRILPLRHDLFDEDAVVLKDTARTVTLETDKDPRRVTVRFPGMPYVGFWHRPKTDAPFLCIEPWCSLPAAEGGVTVFEEKEDLIRLSAGETYRNRWEILIG